MDLSRLLMIGRFYAAYNTSLLNWINSSAVVQVETLWRWQVRAEMQQQQSPKWRPQDKLRGPSAARTSITLPLSPSWHIMILFFEIIYWEVRTHEYLNLLLHCMSGHLAAIEISEAFHRTISISHTSVKRYSWTQPQGQLFFYSIWTTRYIVQWINKTKRTGLWTQSHALMLAVLLLSPIVRTSTVQWQQNRAHASKILKRLSDCLERLCILVMTMHHRSFVPNITITYNPIKLGNWYQKNLANLHTNKVDDLSDQMTN
jgi:hypothetical protein